MDIDEEKKAVGNIDIQDLIFYTPNLQNLQAGNLFRDSMIIEHSLVMLINKGIQAGFLPEVSMDMSVVVAKMYKYLKTHKKKSPNLRVMQRPLLLARSMTITRAANILFNVPGLHEHLHEKSYELMLLRYVKPFLCCTLQTILLAFGYLVNEVYQPIESIIVRAIINGQLGSFPTTRFFDLVHHRNLLKLHGDGHLVQNTTTAPAIYDDELWPLFKDSEHLPLEAMYRESNYNQCWRRVGGAGIGKNIKTKGTTADAVKQAEEAAKNEQPPSRFGRNEEIIDLNYLNLNISLVELVSVLSNRIKPSVDKDNIAGILNDLKGRKLKMMAISPTKVQDLSNMDENEVLPRVEREMNLLETTENDRNCYLCVHIFSETLDKSDSSTLIREAFKSLYYQRLDPRTLLIGTEMNKNYDVEFTMHKITHDDLLDTPRYLTIIDPSHIQSKINTMNNHLVESIANNMVDLLKKHNQPLGEHDKKNDKDTEEPTKMKSIKKIQRELDVDTNKVISQKILETDLQDLRQTNSLIDQVDLVENSTDLSESMDLSNNNKKTKVKKNYITIKEDLDSWAMKKYFLLNGIPMKIDSTTGDTLCKIPTLYGEKKPWGPIPTPLELLKKHKKADGSLPERVEAKLPAFIIKEREEAKKKEEELTPSKKNGQKKATKRKRIDSQEKEVKKPRKSSVSEKPIHPMFMDSNTRTMTEDNIVMSDAFANNDDDDD